MNPMRQMPWMAAFVFFQGAMPLASAQDRPAGNEQPEAVKRGQVIVQFAKERLGKKVGDGQCTSLVVPALQAVGAKTTLDYGVNGPGKDYVWGQPVAKFDDVIPGDILQLRDAKFVTKIETETPSQILTEIRVVTFQHHTAIIAQHLGGGKVVILHQNYGPPEQDQAAKQVVQEMQLNLADKTEGKIWIYRPVKK